MGDESSSNQALDSKISIRRSCIDLEPRLGGGVAFCFFHSFAARWLGGCVARQPSGTTAPDI